MTFWAYILRCSEDSYYTGHTENLDQRVAQHQSGEVEGYTHSRRPVTLMRSQDFVSRIDALEAEHQVKDWSRKRKEALFVGDWGALSAAAKKRLPARVSRYGVSASSTPTRDERVEEGEHIVPASASLGTAPRLRSRGTGEGAGTAIPTAPPPVIVLVRPQLGENIGKAARAMLNFGLVEMRLVAPRDGWPNPSAGPAASGADIVLERAQVYYSVADAVADCTHVYATTVRKRGVTKPVVTPEQAARAIHGRTGRSAILFGPERSGLETDDVALAREIVTVPINAEFGSLNLAQAVILLAYEWSKGMGLASPPETDLPEPAPQEELDGMIGQLDAMLEAAHFFYPPDRTPVTKRTLRTLLTKPGWSSQEVRTFRGVLSALAGRKGPKGSV